MSMSIEQLVSVAHADASAKGFEPGSPAESIALMHSELSEALEELRSGRAIDETYHREDGKPEGVPSELADVVIRIADFCGHYGIDLSAAIEAKLEFNRSRPHKHGKQF